MSVNPHLNSSSFVATFSATGASNVTATCSYSIVGSMVIMYIPSVTLGPVTAPSNIRMSGMPTITTSFPNIQTFNIGGEGPSTSAIANWITAYMPGSTGFEFVGFEGGLWQTGDLAVILGGVIVYFLGG